MSHFWKVSRDTTVQAASLRFLKKLVSCPAKDEGTTVCVVYAAITEERNFFFNRLSVMLCVRAYVSFVFILEQQH